MRKGPALKGQALKKQASAGPYQQCSMAALTAEIHRWAMRDFFRNHLSVP